MFKIESRKKKKRKKEKNSCTYFRVETIVRTIGGSVTEIDG